jgi:c(7)-type cytochrome triheme protein
MNLRFLRFFGAGAACVLLVISLAPAQPVTILLNHEIAFEGTIRPPVPFPHELHMDVYDCLDCHHDYENGENVLDDAVLEEGNPEIKCAFCHTPAAAIDLKDAFHGQCVGCHDIDHKKGPRLCGECHRLPAE